jgi:anti-sigma factor RsiW
MKERIESASCERGNDLVSFLYQELEGRELRDFQQHLSGCSSCSQELASFQEIRSGVVAWRQESLGVNTVPARTAGFTNFAKPSAVAAIRQFFALSPVWLKGAVAFASLLFFAAVISLAMKSGATPQAPMVRSEKVYSEAELRAKVEAGVQERLKELNVINNTPSQEVTQPLLAVARQPTSKSKAGLTAKTRRAPLTKSEREQLAADLRLISQTEDSDLDLLGEHINR